MIALSMLTVGFLGIAALLTQSFFLNRVITNQTTATYLAAEGIEITKNLIDHDVYAHLATPPTGLGWGTCFGAGGDFQIDYTTVDCSALTPYDASRPLSLDPITHLYGYALANGATPTTFARDIRVTMPNANEIIVNSIVQWSTGPLSAESVNLEDHFYNWHP